MIRARRRPPLWTSKRKTSSCRLLSLAAWTTNCCPSMICSPPTRANTITQRNSLTWEPGNWIWMPLACSPTNMLALYHKNLNKSCASIHHIGSPTATGWSTSTSASLTYRNGRATWFSSLPAILSCSWALVFWMRKRNCTPGRQVRQQNNVSVLEPKMQHQYRRRPAMCRNWGITASSIRCTPSMISLCITKMRSSFEFERISCCLMRRTRTRCKCKRKRKSKSKSKCKCKNQNKKMRRKSSLAP
mmetsp:Transcript_20392/g.35187  ORF Transcript_20392/g.35187 Transcript_20392/m.35187 type:complete len:245 (-) Transcript_20392:202-936(-)